MGNTIQKKLGHKRRTWFIFDFKNYDKILFEISLRFCFEIPSLKNCGDDDLFPILILKLFCEFFFSLCVNFNCEKQKIKKKCKTSSKKKINSTSTSYDFTDRAGNV